MQKERKILSIQYLRGVAALGVVLCHYGSSLSSYPLLSSVFNFGQAGVYVFFLICGFINVYMMDKHHYAIKNFFVFISKRLVRINPPYIVVIILTLLLFKILSFVPSFKGQQIPFIPAQFLAHLIYIIPFTKYPFYNHVFWTLSVEFQLYIMIGIFYFLSDSTLYRSVFLIVFCSLSFFTWPNGYYILFTYAPIFALGIAWLTFYQKRTWFNVALPLVFLAITTIKFGSSVALLLVVTCCVIFFYNNKNIVLLFLGNISYSLYLIHPLALIVLVGIGNKFNVPIASYQLICLIFEVGFAILAAFALYLAVEKPSMAFSQRMFVAPGPPENLPPARVYHVGSKKFPSQPGQYIVIAHAHDMMVKVKTRGQGILPPVKDHVVLSFLFSFCFNPRRKKL